MRGYAVDKQTQATIKLYFYTNGFMLWYMSKELFCRELGKRFNLHWRTVNKTINEILKQKNHGNI